MYFLNEQTKRNIENLLHVPYSKLVDIDSDEEYTPLLPADGRKVVFSDKIDSRMVSRGSPYLALGKFSEIDSIDERLSEICDEYTE